MDVGSIVQASKLDLMAKGVAIDLLQMAKRIGLQYEAAEYKDLSGEENLTLVASLKMIEGAIKPYRGDTVELSMKAPMSVSKPVNSGMRSRTVRLRLMVTGGGGRNV